MKNCILVFKNKQYYMEQNADLGYVILTDVLENAKQMPFKEADEILKKIEAKEDWQIWICNTRAEYQRVKALQRLFNKNKGFLIMSDEEATEKYLGTWEIEHSEGL